MAGLNCARRISSGAMAPELRARPLVAMCGATARAASLPIPRSIPRIHDGINARTRRSHGKSFQYAWSIRSSVLACASRSGSETMIKICGVMEPEDAAHAVKEGADFIGMIIWPKAKRSISTEVASEIVKIAKDSGARPVGVFVDEDAETIVQKCEAAGITIAQLHGDGARASLEDIPESLDVIYVLNANSEGIVQTPLPASFTAPEAGGRPVNFVLVDGMQGGSGETFDWTKLNVPSDAATEGWLLAGGLGPHNVAEAIQITTPTGVDVSSGVAGPDGLKKDFEKITGFVGAIRQASPA